MPFFSANGISPYNKTLGGAGANTPPPFEFGNALQFDGVDDYVNTATNTFSNLFYNANGEYTLSFWVKPYSISNYPMLFSSSTTNGNLFLELGNNTNTLYWGSANGFRTYSAVGFSVNTWNHFTITKTALGDNGDIYLNGTLLPTYTGSILDIANINLSLLIGKYVSGSLNINGVMDEIAVWNGVSATAQNAVDLYNSGNGALASSIIPNPTAYWRLNESGTDTIAIDSGGSGSNGTLNNFPTSGMWIPHTSIPFIMTVDTTQAGSASDTFVLPFRSIGSYNCVIDWGDSSSSTITSYNDAALTHVYSTSGTYQISISGSFGGLFFVNSGDKLKLSSIDQWGNNVYQSFDGAFWGCSNMVGTFTDYPNLGTISNLNFMFENCTSFNSNLTSWDTSNVTTMANMFKGAAAFNGDISSWDVSNVTSFTRMFQGASAFNSDISSWDVSSVINMSITFYGATAFDKDLGNWNVSSVTDFTNFMTLKTPSTFLASNLDAIYNGWDSRAVQTPIVITFGSAKHTAASSTARASLVSKGWTITDGGI